MEELILKNSELEKQKKNVEDENQSINLEKLHKEQLAK